MVFRSAIEVGLLFLFLLFVAAYEKMKMHGVGFLLGLSALNFAEVVPGQFSREQWAEMMFAMGVQCQFSCACVASLIAVSGTQALLLAARRAVHRQMMLFAKLF